jgi:[glutamine synthetase] adenylyltransferase / [glutamine synthetase]-adenylyl-L-tyrosine phosphorylase
LKSNEKAYSRAFNSDMFKCGLLVNYWQVTTMFDALTRAKAAELGVTVPLDESYTSEQLALLHTLALSDFAFDTLRANSGWVATLTAPPELAPLVAHEAAAVLTQFRVRRSIAQIALECSGQITVEQSLAYASDTAKCCIAAALALAEAETHARFGTARDANGAAVQLCVFAMGKLGGHELNFSSDVDLILCYASAGESDGPKSLDNAEYFARVTRRVAQLLTERSALGSCYRVDLRLRPFGSDGQPSLSFSAMEDYYQREGRDWERYAWIKARPISGDLAGGERLRELLRPFIYRRYLDFAAFEGMREMKSLVDAEVRKADMGENLKLGPGGIREIEFLIQLQQLIRGGRDAKLRVSGSLPALAALRDAGWLTPEDAAQLRDDYLFLRAVENRVQMIADAQTHIVPADAVQRTRIARSLGYSDAQFAMQLAAVRARVHQRFGEAISLPQSSPATSSTSAFGAPERATAATSTHAQAQEQASMRWQQLTGPNRDQVSDADRPIEISPTLWQALLGFADSAGVQNASARGRSRVDKVVPMLWALALELPPAQVEPCALRLIEFLQAIAGRSAYLALLAEKPAVAQRLVQLFAQSAWLARLITGTPMLLDELLDLRRLHLSNDVDSLCAQLSAEIAAGDQADIEQAFEHLIAFKHSVQMRLAVGFLQERMSALAAVQGLSALADALIDRVLAFAWQEITRQHGLPARCQGARVGFAVLGYGSLGGRELNFASDLDLVFVYDESIAGSDTLGPKIVDGQRFFVKLAQRVISLLTTPTRFGALYAIDTRLRPNGNKGLLVTSLDAYSDYQQHEAWLWEHQALVRARGVTGDVQLLEHFAALRESVLTRPRDIAKVHADVSAMRERLRHEWDRSSATHLDLKQGKDGLVDLEFALQAAVLTCASSPTNPRVPAALVPIATETVRLTAQFFPELAARHETLLTHGLRATLELRPRLIACS